MMALVDRLMFSFTELIGGDSPRADAQSTHHRRHERHHLANPRGAIVALGVTMAVIARGSQIEAATPARSCRSSIPWACTRPPNPQLVYADRRNERWLAQVCAPIPHALAGEARQRAGISRQAQQRRRRAVRRHQSPPPSSSPSPWWWCSYGRNSFQLPSDVDIPSAAINWTARS